MNRRAAGSNFCSDAAFLLPFPSALHSMYKGIDDAGGRYFPQAHTYQRGNVHLYAGSAGGNQQANGNKAEQQRQKQYDQNNDNEGKGHFVLTSR